MCSMLVVTERKQDKKVHTIVKIMGKNYTLIFKIQYKKLNTLTKNVKPQPSNYLPSHVKLIGLLKSAPS